MSKISTLIGALSNLDDSLDSSKSEIIKANITNLKSHFPDFSNGISLFLKQELNDKGVLNDDLVALLTPGKPTNIEIQPVSMINNDIIQTNHKRDLIDVTEITSLKKFRTEYKKNNSATNMFIARNIEEDENFIKCSCPRCLKSSFIVKNK